MKEFRIDEQRVRAGNSESKPMRIKSGKARGYVVKFRSVNKAYLEVYDRRNA